MDGESVLAVGRRPQFLTTGTFPWEYLVALMFIRFSPRASDPRGSKMNTDLASEATPLLIVQAGPIQCGRGLHRKWESLETILDIDYHRIIFQLF